MKILDLLDLMMWLRNHKKFKWSDDIRNLIISSGYEIQITEEGLIIKKQKKKVV